MTVRRITLGDTLRMFLSAPLAFEFLAFEFPTRSALHAPMPKGSWETKTTGSEQRQ
jgi:hypothetical protein